ncbi:hypothetical protein [Yoonia sp. BS5-3]|uniref:Uncharacterized protein n=1 Tax=Yoonia phaeophyticola TaxID=3137369 RepID=A0ABZ2V7J2_9RHOB
MSNSQVLLLIAAFLALTIGSFVWYVATWDAREQQETSFLFLKILPPEAPASATKARS